MNFSEIALSRQSCRAFDSTRDVENEKIKKILNSAILAPSACNSQPYHFTVCRKDIARKVAETTVNMGMNLFSLDAPVVIVISEKPYNKRAYVGSKVKKNDYRSLDIGQAVAYLTLEATACGLSSCIIGWFDSNKIRKICKIDGTVRLLVVLGYAKEEKIRAKSRKSYDEIVTEV